MRFLFVLFVCTVSLEIKAQTVTDSIELAVQQSAEFMRQARYVDAYSIMRYYFNHASPDEKAELRFQQMQKRYREIYGSLKEYLEKTFDDAETASRKGQRNAADSLYAIYLRDCILPEMQLEHPYSVALTYKAMRQQRSGDNVGALSTLERVAQLRQTGEFKDYSHAAETYNLMAAIHHQLGHFDQAISYCEKALEIYRKRYGNNHEYCGTTLSNLAGYYTSRNASGDRLRAVQLGQEAVDMLPSKSPAYAQALSNLVLYYSLSGDKVKAQKYSKAALKSMKRINQSSTNYATLLSNQAIRLANAGNYAQAAEFVGEAIAIFEQNGETQTLNFARLLSNAATFAKHSERYAEAVALWLRAAPIYERIESKTGSGYVDCMSEISAAYAKMGLMEQAADINDELQTTATQQAKRGDARYARSLTKRAAILATDGNYHQARTLAGQALEIYRVRRDTAEMCSTLSDLSRYLYHVGRMQEAVDSCLQALHLYEDVSGHEEDKALALNNLSLFYYADGKTDEALSASERAIQAYEQAGHTQTSHFAKVLANQALFEAARDSVARAIEISLRADSIQRQVLGQEHPDHVMLTFNRAVYHIRLGDTIAAQRLFHESMMQQMRQVRSNFSHLTTRGREMFWGTKSYVFRSAPYMACLMQDIDSAIIDAYNALLFTKGLLLNSEVDFRNLLARTASEQVQDKYASLEALQQQMEQIWRSPTAEGREQLSDLMTQANKLERELVRESKDFGDFTEAMSITVDKVADALPANGAAIEFFDIDTRSGDRTYWALLVHSNDSVPQLVRLFNQTELDTLSYNGLPLAKALHNPETINALYNDSRVGQIVWGNLIPKLKDVSDIWFAPSGLFYQLGIEYLSLDSFAVADRFATHRVSSTKQLVQRNPVSSSANATMKLLSEKVRHAALFGGLDYNASPEAMQMANSQLGEDTMNFLKEYLATHADDQTLADNLTRDGLTRDGLTAVDNLKGAETEVLGISDILFQEDIDVDVFTGVRGTEEAFKSLNGKGVNLLHIATHGFTLSEDVVRRNSGDLTYLGLSDEASAQADNSLCYAGLLMTGANNTLHGMNIPGQLDNGVLTAREIAALDFRGMDLVVLSACQTGLGQLREDGVFGLQRGFKKAGAQTLLMSLWSINDKATMVMMTAFYEALARGATRRVAFQTAQSALRADTNYNQPIYWASFIMLDD